MRKTRAGKLTIAEIIEKISNKFNNQPFALVVVADVLQVDCSRRDLTKFSPPNRTCTRNALDNLLGAYIFDLRTTSGSQNSIHYANLENKVRMIMTLQKFVEDIFSGENPRRVRKRRRVSKSTSAK
jgi:hypothetical protein